MRHASWNEASGLSGTVYALAQTTDGFLWIGASTGLYRFDGLKFEPFFEPASNHPILEVHALLATADGGVWIGHRNGVAFLKQATTSFYNEQQGLPYGRVDSLAQTPDGAIWAAVTGGLARFFNGRWERIQFNWNYPANSSQRVLVDGAGTLWVTGGGSIHFLLRGSRMFQPAKVKVSTWTEVCTGPDGSAWIADPVANTLFNFRAYPETGYLPVTADPLQDINNIRFDSSGALWLATGRALYRIPPGSVTSLPKQTNEETEKDQFFLADGLSGREAKVVLEDREGNIWVGTASGLDRFSDRSVTQIKVGHTPAILIAGPHSEVWASPFGASPFLTPLHDSKPYRLSAQWTTSLYMDRSGTLWTGMQSHSGWEKSRALWKDQDGRLSKAPPPSDVNAPEITAIAGDAGGRLWMIISGHGEYTFQDGKWERVPVFAGEDRNLAPDAEFVDTLGRVWLLYYARNVAVMIDGAKRIFFTRDRGLDVGSPIVGSAFGTEVWIAGTAGLGFFDGNRFVKIRGSDGSSFAGISAILPTDHHGLWLKAPQGVVQIPQDELAAFLHDYDHAVRYRIFDVVTDFGAPLARSNYATTGTDAVRSGDGKLWFAVLGGVAMIDPGHLAMNDKPAPAFIRSLTANGRIYSAYRDLILPKSTREVSLDYTALSLTLSERNRFRYQLVGLDTNWKEAGTRRQAFYTNLEPGTYTFKVIASNNDGIWNNTGAAITFRIPPTFFQTIWFRALVALIFALLLWVFLLIRLRYMNKQTEARLRERLTERERIARELHDTLLQGFQMLVLRFQVITDTLSPDNPVTGLLQESLMRSERALQEGRDRVRALRSEADAGDDLAAEIQRFGDNLSTESATAFQLSVEGTPTILQAVVHEELRMIAHEAIANAFRHARATTIKCGLKFGRRHFTFTCTDDGCGIPEAMFRAKKLHNHWGLVGMQERTRKIGAGLHIQPANPCGTKVEVKLRAGIAYARTMESALFRFFRRIRS
jgi:signal transduction histidine kinase/ligand-binding sensor domain-containing protein